MSRSQIVKAAVWIIYIPPIPERIQPVQWSFQGAGDTQRFAPRTVSVFYHEIAGCVKDPDNIALQTMNIAVFYAVILYKRRSRLRIIEEMQIFRALSAAFIHSSLGQMGNQFTAKNRTVKYNLDPLAPWNPQVQKNCR